MLTSRLLALALMACCAAAVMATPAADVDRRTTTLSGPRPYAPKLYARSSLIDEKAHRAMQNDEEGATTTPRWGLGLLFQAQSGGARKAAVVGARCHGTDGACQDGLFCSLASDVCKPRRGVGEKCQRDAGCADSMSCVNRKCRGTVERSAASPTLVQRSLWPSGHPADKRALQVAAPPSGLSVEKRLLLQPSPSGSASHPLELANTD